MPALLEGYVQPYRKVLPLLYVTAGLFVCAAAFMLVSSGNAQAFLKSRTANYPVDLEPFPLELEGWQSLKEGELDGGVIDALGLDTWLLRYYAKGDGAAALLYVGHIEKESFDYANRHHLPTVCYPNQGWKIVDEAIENIRVESGQQSINRLLVRKGAEEQMLLYWFLDGGEPVFVEKWGRLGIEMAWAASVSSAIASDRRTDKSFIRLSTPVIDGDQEQAWLHLVEFAETVYPQFEQMFN